MSLLNTMSSLALRSNPAFHSFATITERWVKRPATPPILMTRRVYDGFRTARPNAPELQNGWFKKLTIEILDHTGDVYGGDIIYKTFSEASPNRNP